jgi:hypothetical protein
MPTTLRTTRIFPDTITQNVCADRRCGHVVYFAENVRTGNRMIFDTRPAPIAEEREIETQRPIWLIDLSKTVSHFASCVGRDSFRRAR